MVKKKPEAQKKIQQMYLLIEGLLEAADKAGTKNTCERHYLRSCIDWTMFTDQQMRSFGRYQGRVVLISLAAELALKAAWEKEHKEEGPAPTHHHLKDLFGCLSTNLQKKINLEYKHSAKPPGPGWETPKLVFEKCNDAYKTWEYLGEEGKKQEWRMEAKWLKASTLAVLQAAFNAQAQQDGDDKHP